jgi:hypothetical protein
MTKYATLGTPLPKIPIGIRIKVNNENKKWEKSGVYTELVSFGVVIHNGETCVLTEREGYTGSLHLVFPLIEIEQLEKKIIGYLVPTNMYNGIWKKDDVVTLFTTANGTYYVDGKKYVIPKEIAETWTPVYEEDKKQAFTFIHGTTTYSGFITKDEVHVRTQRGTESTSITNHVFTTKELITMTDYIASLEKLNTNLGQYAVSVDSIKIGCQSIPVLFIIELRCAFNQSFA